MPIHFLGTTREHYILLFSAAGAVGLLAGIAGAWIGAYFGARRAVHSAQLEVSSDRARLAQVDPIMTALDAISLEVERISEAQRFQARLLSDRPMIPLPRSDSRNITPH